MNDRIVMIACPVSSKACSCNGLPEGRWKNAEPSSRTGTVPSTFFVISLSATLRLGTDAVGWQMMELTRSAFTFAPKSMRPMFAFWI